mmetsp:Transcript_9029/g.22021  ORF Transcript_9029/g.22021 Transcript_9029/m.22021 type:complete len:326 (+) Transcript_9029:95-1072(+)
MSRTAETLASIPLSTRFIMGLCIITYAYQFLFDPPLQDYTMCPRNVLYLHEYYRILTSSIFHANLMHIGMNMMSTMAIGSMLEKNQLGTLMMCVTILWGIILTSFIYIFVSWLLFAAFGYERLMLQHSVGFSGVIFQLSVLESNLGPNRTRSVFGLFQVSSKMYPWALLVALQFIMPQISFMGHLSGILVGTLQYYGALDVIFPSETYLRERCESSGMLEGLRGQSGYVAVPEAGWRREDDSELRSSLCGAFGCIILYVKNAWESIRVCVFGSGVEANANIQLAWGSGDDTPTTGGMGTMHHGGVEEDEEWVGLPAAIHRSTEEM